MRLVLSTPPANYTLNVVFAERGASLTWLNHGGDPTNIIVERPAIRRQAPHHRGNNQTREAWQRIVKLDANVTKYLDAKPETGQTSRAASAQQAANPPIPTSPR